MREFLIAITGEWRSYIENLSILLFFLLGIAYGSRIKKRLYIPEDKWYLTSGYYIFGIVVCAYILWDGLYIVCLYLHIFKNFVSINFIIFIFYTIYSMLFFLSVCRFSFSQQYALRNTKIYLFSFPFFTILTPICSFIICTIINGDLLIIEQLSIFDFFYSKNPNEYIQKIRLLGILGDIIFYIMLIIPWTIYFCFSSTVKKLWVYIDSEYDNFHEGENILPKWVLD